MGPVPVIGTNGVGLQHCDTSTVHDLVVLCTGGSIVTMGREESIATAVPLHRLVRHVRRVAGERVSQTKLFAYFHVTTFLSSTPLVHT